MRRQSFLGMLLIALVPWSAPGALAAAAAGGQAGEAKSAASAAAKASPELVGALSKELGSTPEQAAGAAGALFSVAKSRLSPGDFGQVAKAVPGMDSLLQAAPSSAAPEGALGAVSKVAGTAGNAVSAASAFSNLGLKPEMVSKAIPVLTSFVSKSGGADVGRLLAGALK